MTWDFKYKPEPDFNRLLKILKRQTKSGPVPILELSADMEIMQEICGRQFSIPLGLSFYDDNFTPEKESAMRQVLDLNLEFALKVGYDTVKVSPMVPMPFPNFMAAENTALPGKKRGWMDEHGGLIATREDVERYPWPDASKINLFPLDYLAERLPANMKLHALVMGIFEAIRWLMGFENFSLACIQNPELVDGIFERLARVVEALVDKCAAHPAVGFIAVPDDMGFNSGAMISPELIRKWVIPREKRIADACRRHNKPFVFHCCGNIEAIILDEIDTVKIDAWHAFQDNILPVELAYEKYSDRVAILGGVDLDLLARAAPGQVCRRVREILETCGEGGGYCLGSGNSLANYIKLENFRVMLEEGWKWNQERS
jgi:uroporphyrinogen decarboxylase